MSEKKLTPKMQEVYDLMKSGHVAHYMKYMGRFNPNPYWFLSGNMMMCTAQVNGLIKRGLVVITKRDAEGVASIAEAKKA